MDEEPYNINKTEDSKDSEDKPMDEEPIRKNLELYEYQKKAVAAMLEMEEQKNCNGGFLCFEMGLGKTGTNI